MEEEDQRPSLRLVPVVVRRQEEEIIGFHRAGDFAFERFLLLLGRGLLGHKRVGGGGQKRCSEEQGDELRCFHGDEGLGAFRFT